MNESPGEQEDDAGDQEHRAIFGKQVSESCSADDDSTGDFDEVSGGQQAADEVDRGGHGVAWEEEAADQDRGKKDQIRHLKGLRLMLCLGGHQ